jgi:hypothetical protein
MSDSPPRSSYKVRVQLLRTTMTAPPELMCEFTYSYSFSRGELDANVMENDSKQRWPEDVSLTHWIRMPAVMRSSETDPDKSMDGTTSENLTEFSDLHVMRYYWDRLTRVRERRSHRCRRKSTIVCRSTSMSIEVRTQRRQFL